MTSPIHYRHPQLAMLTLCGRRAVGVSPGEIVSTCPDCIRDLADQREVLAAISQQFPTLSGHGEKKAPCACPWTNIHSCAGCSEVAR